jgi:hypothetical protein
MRLVAKLDVRRSIEPIYTLPGDLNLLICVFDNLLHLGPFPRQLGVAQHAFGYGRNTGGRPNVGASMAI